MNRTLRYVQRVYLLGGISNMVATIPAFLAYNRYVDLFLSRRPNYPFLVWIWAGMAFVWGISFFEIARDPLRAYPLVKYSWIEKCVTSLSVIVAFAVGDVHGSFLIGVCVTDVMWIPLFVSAHVRLAATRPAYERSIDGTRV